jgi:hypothetical protein
MLFSRKVFLSAGGIRFGVLDLNFFPVLEGKLVIAKMIQLFPEWLLFVKLLSLHLGNDYGVNEKLNQIVPHWILGLPLYRDDESQKGGSCFQSPRSTRDMPPKGLSQCLGLASLNLLSTRWKI